MRIYSFLSSVLLATVLGLFVGMSHAQESAAQQQANIDSMLRLAQQARLDQSAEWHKINQYHPTLGGVKSRVDDASYFLAANGKRDPQAELEATIRAAYDEGMAEQSRQPKLCRWVARYQYLNRSMKELGFDYPAPRCEGFERWKSGMARDHVTMIFASIYLNSPASMYGHIFMRFDSTKAGEFNRLSDTTVGYTVNSNGDFGPLFLAQSLAGGFPGNFVSVPYFMKVREYADLENRDLWEYQTDFTPEEIDKMHAFIWEQSFTYADYYFADDNCALILLATLEAGRPNLGLIASAKPWLAPLDTVKVLRDANVLTKKRYRPSQYSTLISNVERAPDKVREQAVALAHSLTLPEEIPGVNAQEQAQLLDLALGVLEYERNQKNSEQEAAPLNQFQLKLAMLRSKVDASATYQPAPTPRQSPDEGHNSFRVGMALGQVDGVGYGQLSTRLVYHDGLDPNAGFSPGVSSKIGDLYLRFNDKNIRFERLDLFEVFLPSVRTDWYRPLTIKANISVRREVQRNDVSAPTVFRIELGGGEGYRISEHSQMYVIADTITRLRTGASSLAAGPVAGWMWQPEARWRAEASVGAFWNVAGGLRDTGVYRVTAGVAWDVFNDQNNIRLNASRQSTSKGGAALDSYSDVQLAYFHYF
ncbi:MAG: DUF4105 domain-containing protein [Sideroxydans sp.]|nr:DUF4105 domain-containing protein [Sideroxydans sp.]